MGVYSDYSILGLIPARGGSKGIPRKNLAPLAGRPLIAHTIAAGLKAGSIGRLVVSTDDPEIAGVARQQGAEVPFMRPAELAGDQAGALEVIQHAVQTLEAAGDWRADIVVYLQPTSPLRRAEHIDAAVALLMDESADSVVSVVPVPHNFNPTSVMKLENGLLKPFLGEAGPLRRQDKPRVLARNGPAVLAVTRNTIMEQGALYGPRTLPLIMEPQDSLDIDTLFDLELAQWMLERRERLSHGS